MDESVALDVGRGLEEDIEKIRSLDVERLNVPKFRIANWPEHVGEVKVKVRKAGFCRWVSLINREHSPFYEIRRRFITGLFRHSFTIGADGSILIHSTAVSIGEVMSWDKYSGASYKDEHYKLLNIQYKASCLLLFNYLKKWALPLVVRKVESDVRHNAETIRAVREALEPFLPGIMADKLAD